MLILQESKQINMEDYKIQLLSRFSLSNEFLDMLGPVFQY